MTLDELIAVLQSKGILTDNDVNPKAAPEMGVAEPVIAGPKTPQEARALLVRRQS